MPVLLATIPVNCETSSLIANATLELRRVLFLLGAYLIYGSGDGLTANLAAFRMVKDQSSGTPETKIGDVVHPCQLYFGTAGDPKEHDTKALFNQNKGNNILVNDREETMFPENLLKINEINRESMKIQAQRTSEAS